MTPLPPAPDGDERDGDERDGDEPDGDERDGDDEVVLEHPRGALLFMLFYLLMLTALWLNAYMRLWRH
jgi:hypothetical protein